MKKSKLSKLIELLVDMNEAMGDDGSELSWADALKLALDHDINVNNARGVVDPIYRFGFINKVRRGKYTFYTNKSDGNVKNEEH